MSTKFGGKVLKERSQPKPSDKLKASKCKVTDESLGICSTTSSTSCDLAAVEFKEDQPARSCKDGIKSLQVDGSVLKSNLMPQPPMSKPKTKVIVRRVIPVAKEPERKHAKKVFVVKPHASAEVSSAMMNAAPKDWPSAHVPVQAHHIIGSLDELRTEASKRGELDKFCLPQALEIPMLPSLEGLAKPCSTGSVKEIHLNQENALRNWQRQIDERRRLQQHLTKTMQLPADMLVMNQSENYRQIQEERAIIDRAIPAMDHGKGYRVGSEFWRQVEMFGGEERGLSITLTQTEKGFAPPVEQIAKPAHVQQEMGLASDESSQPFRLHYPWFESTYLRERKMQLEKVYSELKPHRPYMDKLEVVGASLHNVGFREQPRSNGKSSSECDVNPACSEVDADSDGTNPLDAFDNVIAEPIIGPFIWINDQPVPWTGCSTGCEDDNGVTVRLLFDANVEEFGASNVEIRCDGTAAVCFYWERVRPCNPFEMMRRRPIHRFYFDQSEGVILPGNVISIPYLFKSPNAGIFTEIWRLKTRPVLCGGAPITVILRGVASIKDHLFEKRMEFKKELANRECTGMMKRIVSDLLQGVGTPPRPSSPVQGYTTEEQLFSLKNSNMFYTSTAVKSLMKLHQQVEPDQTWDLSIQAMYHKIARIADMDVRESILHDLNNDIAPLLKPALAPVPKTTYPECYQALCLAMDKVAWNAGKLRSVLALPEKEFRIKIEDDAKKTKKTPSTELQHKSRTEARSVKKESPSTSRGKTPALGGKGKGKDVFGVPSSNNGKLAVSGESEYIAEKSRKQSLAVVPQEKQDVNDPLYGKFLERFHVVTYACLADAIDALEIIIGAETPTIV